MPVMGRVKEGVMPRKARHGEAKRWVERVARLQTDECQMWPFLAAAGETPRPVIGRGSHGIWPVTHAVLDQAGRTLAPGEQANHTCDEALCCNPRHLYAGTQQQNTRDAILRGRRNVVSDEMIQEVVRLSATRTVKEISEALGITYWAARYHSRLARKVA